MPAKIYSKLLRHKLSRDKWLYGACAIELIELDRPLNVVRRTYADISKTLWDWKQPLDLDKEEL